MLLTLTLNFLPACPKNLATGPTFGPFYKKAKKAKKLTICIGNTAPFRTFLLKNLEKFYYRFFRKQKLNIYWPLLSYLAENQPGVCQFYRKQSEREKCIAENVLVDIVTRS
jgi:hypothetical protein